MAGNLNSGMCSPLCSDACAFYLPQGLTHPPFAHCERRRALEQEAGRTGTHKTQTTSPSLTESWCMGNLGKNRLGT